MSAPAPATKGALQDLDLLREDGRRRLLTHCSRQELEEIIIAGWRERDERAKANVSQGEAKPEST
jgi:hypothetical protein